MTPVSERLRDVLEGLFNRNSDGHDPVADSVLSSHRVIPVSAEFSSLSHQAENASQPALAPFFDELSGHDHNCGCVGCQIRDTSAADAGPHTVSVGSGRVLPLETLQNLADFLREGYWQATDSVTRKFNLETIGFNTKAGVIYFNLEGFSDLSGYTDLDGLVDARKDLVREVFKLYSEVLGIEFRETASSADIYFSDNEPGAFAISTGYSNAIAYSLVNVAADWDGGRSGYNSYTLQTFFHEIGHALGLGHLGPYNKSAEFAKDARFANDSWQASMMSYFDQGENPNVDAEKTFLHTPMPVDWLALEDIYGTQSAEGTRFGVGNAFLGDTTYGFNTTISSAVSDLWARYSEFAGSTVYTLIDAGGHDMIDVSGYSADQRIDLSVADVEDRRLVTSDIGGLTENLILAVGTIVESAKGGAGHDSFTGNDAANSFWGNSGNDWFFNTPGLDRYFGGAGDDTVFFAAPFASYDLVFDYTTGLLDIFDKTLGVITAIIDDTVEWLSFQDITVAFGDAASLSDPLPTAKILAIVDDAGIYRGDVLNGLSDDATPTLMGSLSEELETGETLAIYRDGGFVGTATVTGPIWVFTDSSLSDGSHGYQAAVLRGKASGPLSDPATVTLDTTAPLITLVSAHPQDDGPALFGTVASDATQVSITLDGQVLNAEISSGGWTLAQDTLPNLDPGTYSVSASATDATGNIGTVEGSLTIEPTVAAIFAIGSQTLAQDTPDQWHSVEFDAPIANAIVAMGGLSSNDSDPAHVRVRNVSDTGFEFKIEEWDYLDGRHGTETVSWIAVSAGSHTIGGLTVEAGRSTARNETFRTEGLTHDFDAAPVVLAQVTSDAESSAVTTRLRNVTADSFQFQMQEEEAADGKHALEQIDWIAIEQGEGLHFDAHRTLNVFTDQEQRVDFDTPVPETAILLGAMQTRDGNNVAGTRISTLDQTGATFFVDEEQSLDSETDHTTEVIGFLIAADALVIA